MIDFFIVLGYTIFLGLCFYYFNKKKVQNLVDTIEDRDAVISAMRGYMSDEGDKNTITLDYSDSGWTHNSTHDNPRVTFTEKDVTHWSPELKEYYQELVNEITSVQNADFQHGNEKKPRKKSQKDSTKTRKPRKNAAKPVVKTTTRKKNK